MINQIGGFVVDGDWLFTVSPNVCGESLNANFTILQHQNLKQRFGPSPVFVMHFVVPFVRSLVTVEKELAVLRIVSLLECVHIS